MYEGFAPSQFTGNSVQGGNGANGKSNGGSFNGVGGGGGGPYPGMGGGSGSAGNGGFASGGGGGAGNSSGNGHGGDGGFGGGGGGGGAKTSGGLGGNAGQGGFGGGDGGREGCSAAAGGGGGAGFGGAIFNHLGQVEMSNVLFESNQALVEQKGTIHLVVVHLQVLEKASGGAIFNYQGQLRIQIVAIKIISQTRMVMTITTIEPIFFVLNDRYDILCSSITPLFTDIRISRILYHIRRKRCSYPKVQFTLCCLEASYALR